MRSVLSSSGSHNMIQRQMRDGERRGSIFYLGRDAFFFSIFCFRVQNITRYEKITDSTLIEESLIAMRKCSLSCSKAQKRIRVYIYIYIHRRSVYSLIINGAERDRLLRKRQRTHRRIFRRRNVATKYIPSDVTRKRYQTQDNAPE